MRIGITLAVLGSAWLLLGLGLCRAASRAAPRHSLCRVAVDDVAVQALVASAHQAIEEYERTGVLPW